jgi:hypothetical protein
MCATSNFNLFEVLELEKALATGEFGDVDGEAVRQMLAEAARVALSVVSVRLALCPKPKRLAWE